MAISGINARLTPKKKLEMFGVDKQQPMKIRGAVMNAEGKKDGISHNA